MRLTRLLPVVALMLLAILAGCAGQPQRDTLYQVSTITALMEGAYDGTTSVGELRRHGDFGLGTFDRLDGEMIVLDGRVYQARADGSVHSAPDALTTPFAAVTFFESAATLMLDAPLDLGQLTERLDRALPTANLIYASRVTGEFDSVKVRSVPAQAKPYPRLIEVTKTQPTFEYRQVRGTLVILRLPAYAAGLNVPGYHVHFLSDDRTRGGHVLECRLSRGQAAINAVHGLRLVLPHDGEFAAADLRRGSPQELQRIEQ